MLILRPELCQVLTQDELSRLRTALDALGNKSLEADTRWRVMQIEGVLAAKPNRAEEEEP